MWLIYPLVSFQIPRYIVTLHELLAHTPHDHVDRKSLMEARQKLEDLSRQIKDEVSSCVVEVNGVAPFATPTSLQGLYSSEQKRGKKFSLRVSVFLCRRLVTLITLKCVFEIKKKHQPLRSMHSPIDYLPTCSSDDPLLSTSWITAFMNTKLSFFYFPAFSFIIKLFSSITYSLTSTANPPLIRRIKIQ